MCETTTGFGRRASFVAAAILGACGLAVPAASAQEPDLTFAQIFEMEWLDVQRRTPDIFLAGYDALWLPPPSKASDPFSVEYDVFDRFDRGKPPLNDDSFDRARTNYGTEATYRTMIDRLHRAGIQVYSDSVLNHNSGRTTSDAFFEAGGWPGFWVPRSTNSNGDFVDKQPEDDWGDFHGGIESGFFQSENPGAPRYDLFRGDLVALVDINQFNNNQFIRQPVDPDDPDNIPAGTFRNQPDPENVRFYPDTDAQPRTFTNPLGPDFDGEPGPDMETLYPFTDPFKAPFGEGEAETDVGDPVTGNTTAYLMRWSRWMIEVIGVDGFRLDASKHVFNTWWDQFYDTAVHMARVLPDGTRVNPLSFGENTTGNDDILNRFFRKDDFANRDSLDLAGAGALRGINNAGGFGSWQDVLNSHLDTADDGLQNGSAGVMHVFSHDNGSVGDGNSLPRRPTLREQALAQHAYLLLRPGKQLVYHNARGVQRDFGFFPREGVPIALGLNPETQTPDDTFQTLNRIRQGYVRGEFNVLNAGLDDLLTFELSSDNGQGRRANLLVGVSDRYDPGDFGASGVIVSTSFPEGTRLMELTGNAENPAVDPEGVLPEFITVGSNGTVQLGVPRNASPTGEHNLGFIAYGPPTPGGTLTIGNTSGVIPPDPAIAPDAQQRVNDFPIVTDDTFTIRLETFAQDDIDAVSDDNAVFRINNGFGDFNGDGGPDNPPSQVDTVVAGFEDFTDLRDPGMTNPDLQGVYEQTIDAAALGDGFHYITVRAFRQRPAGTDPLFSEFREVVYVDRVPADLELEVLGEADDPTPRVAITAEGDTVEAVFAALNVPDGTDPSTLVTSQNRVTQYDAREWRTTFAGELQAGVNTVTVVGLESNLREVVEDFDIVFGDASCNPADLAMPFGLLDGADVNAFITAFGGGDDAADLSGDGVVDGADVNAFISAFGAGCP